MEKSKALVLAQGKSSRWNNYMGIPKHLVEIDNEKLVDRACRLFSKYCDVVLICPNDNRYPLEYPHVTLEDPYPTGTEMDKFLSNNHLWNSEGETIITWGDCYYTENAVETICNQKVDTIHYFRRPYASKITGHKWDESFAVKFSPSDHNKVVSIAWDVVKMVKDKQIKKDHIRTHYAKFLGLEDFSRGAIIDTPHQTIIDDWTDDIDSPKEYHTFISRYKKQ